MKNSCWRCFNFYWITNWESGIYCCLPTGEVQSLLKRFANWWMLRQDKMNSSHFNIKSYILYYALQCTIKLTLFFKKRLFFQISFTWRHGIMKRYFSRTLWKRRLCQSNIAHFFRRAASNNGFWGFVWVDFFPFSFFMFMSRDYFLKVTVI